VLNAAEAVSEMLAVVDDLALIPSSPTGGVEGLERIEGNWDGIWGGFSGDWGIDGFWGFWGFWGFGFWFWMFAVPLSLFLPFPPFSLNAGGELSLLFFSSFSSSI